MSAFCSQCTVKLFQVDARKNELALPLFRPFARRREELCEQCGWIEADSAGYRLTKLAEAPEALER